MNDNDSNIYINWIKIAYKKEFTALLVSVHNIVYQSDISVLIFVHAFDWLAH